VAFALRCPECRRAFRWDVNKKFPRYCQFEDCKADFGEERPDDEICMPAFLTAKNKSVDQVYRDTERLSEARAEKAAEMLGVPASEMSDMKITDFRPTKHEGAIAAPPVVNEVTQRMDQMAAMGLPTGFGVGPTGAEYCGAVSSGPFPNVGAKMRSMIHQANGAVSDRPALETLAPGYVRRA
jgi:hypothetical protein